MGIFGWSLPPGCSQRDIDPPEAPCDVCGKAADNCICPDCPVCGTAGNVMCYANDMPEQKYYTVKGRKRPRHHGLSLTDAQQIARAEMRIRDYEDRIAEERYAIDVLKAKED